MSKLINRVGRVVAPGVVEFLKRQVEEAGPHQVVVKIVSSAICGSDLHIFKGKHPSAPLPVTIGHEFSGEVVATGSEVTKVKIGDRVTVEPVVTCGKCMPCRTGNYGYCEQISFTYRTGNGAMADYITVEEAYLYKLREHLSYDAGALLEPSPWRLMPCVAQIEMGEKGSGHWRRCHWPTHCCSAGSGGNRGSDR